MAFIGSVLHYIWMVLSGIPVVLLMASGRLFLPEPVRYQIGLWWCKSAIYSLRWLCGVQWRVQGLENIPTDPQAKIFVHCKHQSTWETFAMGTILGKNLVFIFKKELLKIPLFGWAIGSVDMVHIDRRAKTQAMQVMSDAAQRMIKASRWIIMFPEGTRVPRGESIPYKTGGARTAILTHADILPVAVSSGQCWPKGRFTKHAGIIDVVVGPVIKSEGKEAHELAREVQAWIEGQMRIIDASAYEHENLPNDNREESA
ncbi:MAG: lysophospholipid acyltransferase family protein [Saezia sp.]